MKQTVQKVINGEELFQVKATRFSLGRSASGYTLKSAPLAYTDRTRFDSDSSAIPAGYPLDHLCAVPGKFYFLSGNTGAVDLVYEEGI